MKFKKVVEYHGYDRNVEIIYTLHKNNQKYLNRKFSQYNITALQAMCLLILDDKKDMNQQEIADLLFLTKSAITQVTKKLESEGYINKTKSKTDGRQYVLNLSENGKDIIPKIEIILKEWEEKLTIDKADDEFINTLIKLADNSIQLNK